MADVVAAELEHGRHVPLSVQGFITGVVSLELAAGRWIVSATVSLANRGDWPVDVDVWLSLVGGTGARSVYGPRSAHATVPAAGLVAVAVGPAVVDLAGVVTGQLAAARAAGDPANPDDVVLAMADTDVGGRAAPTGVLALGVNG